MTKMTMKEVGVLSISQSNSIDGCVHCFRHKKFENGVFTVTETHKMFSVHASLGKFEKAIISVQFGFVLEENSGREITCLTRH